MNKILIVFLSCIFMFSCQKSNIENKTLNNWKVDDLNIYLIEDNSNPFIQIKNNELSFYEVDEKKVDKMGVKNIVLNNTNGVSIRLDYKNFDPSKIKAIFSNNLPLLKTDSNKKCLLGIIYEYVNPNEPPCGAKAKIPEKRLSVVSVGKDRLYEQFTAISGRSKEKIYEGINYTSDYSLKDTILKDDEVGTIIFLDKDYILTKFFNGNIINQYIINPDIIENTNSWLGDFSAIACADITKSNSSLLPRGFLELKVGERKVVDSGLSGEIDIPVEFHNGSLAISLGWLAEKLGCAYSYYHTLRFDDAIGASWGSLSQKNPCIVSRVMNNRIIGNTQNKMSSLLKVVSLKEDSSDENKQLDAKGKSTSVLYKNGKQQIEKEVSFDLPFTPYVKNGHFMVPLLETCKQLGAEVHYRDLDNSILIAKFFKEEVVLKDYFDGEMFLVH